MFPGDTSFDEIDFGEDDTPIGALLATVSVNTSFRGAVDNPPTYNATIFFRPGNMASLYIENDTDFNVNNLVRARDNSPVNDAVLTGSICRSDITGQITGATNAGPIVITSNGHGLTTGQQVVVDQVEGNTAANGCWTITVIDANTFSLNGSTGNAAFIAGNGQWWLAIPNACNISLAYVAGTNGNYVGTIPAGVDMPAGNNYVRFVFCSNYGVHWGSTAISAAVRQ